MIRTRAVRTEHFRTIRALDRRVRADYRKAVVAGVLALAALSTGHALGGPHAHNAHVRIAVFGCAAAFVVFGVTTTVCSPLRWAPRRLMWPALIRRAAQWVFKIRTDEQPMINLEATIP